MKLIPPHRDYDTLYELVEHWIMLILVALVMVVALIACYRLVVGVAILVLTGFDPSRPEVLQGVLGMFFTVLILLEFKRSLLLVSGPREGVVRVRSIILIGMLATVRKFIVTDLGHADWTETLAVSGAILALGVVYWLVREQDRRLPAQVAAGTRPETSALPE